MGINDVSGWFRRILGPLNPNLGPWSPVEPCMKPAGVVWRLSRFEGVWSEKSPEKKVLECVWG